MIRTKETIRASWWCEWLVSGAASSPLLNPPQFVYLGSQRSLHAAFAALKYYSELMVPAI